MAETGMKFTKKEALEYAVDHLLDSDCPQEVMDKLEGMIAQEVKRAEYSATHRKPTKAKGPTEATKEVAEAISSVLTDTPMTATEINEALGTDHTALRVAGAIKFIPGVKSQKVVRPTIGKNGLRAERQYTGYFIG